MSHQLNGYHKIDMRKYHKGEGLSSSGMLKGLISLAHQKAYNEKEYDITANLGNTVHALVLEPDTHNFELKLHGRTPEGKAQIRDAKENFRMLATPSVWENAKKIASKLRDHLCVQDILKKCEKEISGFASDRGILYKIRPDMIDHQKKTIYDLKTVRKDMDERKLYYFVRDQGWHIKAAFYQYVNKLITNSYYKIIHIYVEVDEPYQVKIRNINQELMDSELNNVIMPYLPMYKMALDTGMWPGFDSGIKDLTPPEQKEHESWNIGSPSQFQH